MKLSGLTLTQPRNNYLLRIMAIMTSHTV